MSVITNFNTLSENELQQFAKTLVHKINKDFIFSSDVTFKIESVEADELSGDLMINVINEDTVEVPRKANWQCVAKEDISNPERPECHNDIYRDTKKVFKSLEANIDGYKVTITIEEVDEGELTDVIVDNYEYVEDGIGEYEYWGHVGYDSCTYIEVVGTIVQSCNCYFSLLVEPR